MLFFRWDILRIRFAIFCMEEIFFTISVAIGELTHSAVLNTFFLFGVCIMGMS